MDRRVPGGKIWRIGVPGRLPFGVRAPQAPSSGARVTPAPNVRVSRGVRLPPISAIGADVTADAGCSGGPVIHGNPEAGPGARIAAFAGLRGASGLRCSDVAPTGFEPALPP